MYLNKIKLNLNVSIVVLVALLPATLHSFDEMSNLTNIIDRRRTNSNSNSNSGSFSSITSSSSSGPSYEEDQSLDVDYTLSSDNFGSCSVCRARDEVRSRSLESIKEQILLGLGMQNAPNTTGRKFPQVPQGVLSQYPNLVPNGMMADQPQQPTFKPGPSIIEEEDNIHIKTEKVLVFSKPYPKIRHGLRGGGNNQVQGGIQYFSFSDKITRHRVKLATLFVWVRGSGEERPVTTDIHIKVYKVLKDQHGLVLKSSAKVRQSIGEGQWIKMDATVMVSEWFKNNKDNYGFVVNATMVNGQKIVVTDHTIEGGEHMPFVDIETTDGRRRRTKRTLGLNCNEDMEEKLCCRYPLTVDFVEFGWDFIIAPRKYEANYCAGECPYLTLQKFPHSHIAKMAKNSTNPCCTARKMSSISMLYFDADLNIIYGSLPGMVVDRCGCS